MRLKRSHVDAGERVTQILVRRHGDEPRSYGSPPMEVVLVLVLAGLPVGIWLIAIGHLWVGLLLLAIACVLSFVLAGEIVEALLDGSLTQHGRHAAGWMQRRAAFSRVAVSESAGAAAEVVRLRLDRHRLERRLDRLTHELGEAVFSGDPALAEVVNDKAHETAAELQAAADERERVLLAARARIERQRASAAGVVSSTEGGGNEGC